MVRTYFDEFLALSAKDPVSGCNVVWSLGDQLFRDPCRGGEYDERGRTQGGAGVRGLVHYPVRIQGERLYVLISGPAQPIPPGQ